MFAFAWPTHAVGCMVAAICQDAKERVLAKVARRRPMGLVPMVVEQTPRGERAFDIFSRDRKSTRLNSSHGYISYAVFCLKKKKTDIKTKQYNKKNTQTRLRHTRDTL